MDEKCTRIISARLREIRKNRGFSQETVRECTGINVSKYETGDRLPRIDTLIKIGNFYKVNISYFFK